MDEARQVADQLCAKNGQGSCGWFTYMEFHDTHKNSHKFYEAGEDRNGFYVKWGRVGTSGTRKEHPSFMSIVRKVEEKADKGYVASPSSLVNGQVRHGRGNGYVTVQDGQSQLKPQSHDSLAFYRNNPLTTVDLTGISAMFQIVKTVRWDAALDQWRGFNAEGEIVMTVPESVMVQWEVDHG